MAGMWCLEETVDATGLHQHPLLLTLFWAFYNPFPPRADCINRGRERACDWCSDKALVSELGRQAARLQRPRCPPAFTLSVTRGSRGVRAGLGEVARE